MPEDDEPSISRCPHDAENPYAQISRALIRDPGISPECAYLLIYLLSQPRDWKIRVSALKAEMKGRLGRDKVEKCLKEARDAGYMQLVRSHNQKGHIKWRYLLSEAPKFKEIHLHPENQGPGNPAPGESGHIRKKESKKERVTNSLSNERETSAVASSLCDRLVLKIRSWAPDFTMKSHQLWNQEMDRLIRVDKRSPEQIKQVIDWVQSDEFWRENVLSPKKLRQKFSELQAKMVNAGTKGLKDTNRQRMMGFVKLYPDTFRRGIWVTEGFQNPSTKEVISFNTAPEDLEQAMQNAFLTSNGYPK